MRSASDRVTPSVIGDIAPDGAALDKLTDAEIAIALAATAGLFRVGRIG